MTTTETNEQNAAPSTGVETSPKKSITAWVAAELADALQTVADKKTRGNRTLLVEQYFRQALAQEKILPVGVRHQLAKGN